VIVGEAGDRATKATESVSKHDATAFRGEATAITSRRSTMNWLLQNWVWVALAIGAVWMFRRGGLAGCGMGGHGSHGGQSELMGSSSGGMRSGGGQTGDVNSPGGEPPVADTAGKAIDPVSGHEVLIAQAVTALYQGRALYFENPVNRQRFEATPAQYTHNMAPASQPQHRHRGCC
jgi:YHS domain-containing protein